MNKFSLHLFDRDNDYVKSHEDFSELERTANNYTVTCIMVTYLLFFLTWLLNLLHIFIVDDRLMNTSMIVATFVIVVLSIIAKYLDLSKRWVKYVIIFFAVLVTGIVEFTLTYHAVIAFTVPIIYSVQYSSKKLVYYTYILTVISLFFVVLGGYKYGLCDANMVYLTTKPLADYTNQFGVVDLGDVNNNIYLTLPLYYVFPRALLLLALIPVMLKVAGGIAEREVRERQLKRISEYDDMTSLYNKNKYRTMVSEVYPRCSQVGVIFWDLNGLKETNDKLGHELGDRLIASMADSIRPYTTETAKAYRIGGDEFVMVIENGTEEDVKNVILMWKGDLENENKNRKAPLSAACGYAVGAGENIDAVIKEADDDMYRNKVAMKKNRK